MDATGAAPAPSLMRTKTHPTDTPRPTIQTNETFKPSLPITIPRRKSVRPPARSPIRHQASPDLVFNFDFSVSPCSLHGHQQVLMKYAPQPLLQQHGRASILLPHGQCSFEVEEDDGVEKRPYRNEPFLYSVPKVLLRPYGAHMRSQLPPQLCSDRTVQQSPEKDHANNDHVLGEIDALADPLLSPVSASSRSPRKQYAFLFRDCDDLASRKRAENMSYGEPSRDGRLISAFQRRLASDSTSPSDPPSASTSIDSPASSPPSPVSLAALPPPSPVSPPPPPRHRSRWRPTVPTAFRKAQMRPSAIRTAAAPVVSFKVAQAEPCPRLNSAWSPSWGETERRGRSPCPGQGFRSRRGSSVASGRGIDTVVGIGRGLRTAEEERRRPVSLVLSNEDIECSLEKAYEPGDGAKLDTHRGEVGADEKDWEEERGSTRGRTLTRRKGAVRR